MYESVLESVLERAGVSPTAFAQLMTSGVTRGLAEVVTLGIGEWSTPHTHPHTPAHATHPSTPGIHTPSPQPRAATPLRAQADMILDFAAAADDFISFCSMMRARSRQLGDVRNRPDLVEADVA